MSLSKWTLRTAKNQSIERVCVELIKGHVMLQDLLSEALRSVHLSKVAHVDFLRGGHYVAD